MKGKKVLIAEDDPIARKILVNVVETSGCIAIQASRGDTAWQVLADNPDIGLLLTDVAMPGLDGRELLKIIRGQERMKELPVIVISGVIGPKEIDSLLQLGASRFLPKPINAQELEEYIGKLL